MDGLSLAGAIAITTLVFLAIHWLVARRSRHPFRRTLRLSRGIAAAILVATGVASIVHWWELAPRGFVAVHPDLGDAWPVAIFLGHLLADLLWFVGARLALGARTARDLVLHHLLGVAACGAALWLEAGYATLGAILITELLPVQTGLGALARAWKLQNVEHWVLRTSLATVLLVRIPLWLALGTAFTRGWLAPGPPEILSTVAPYYLGGLALVLPLDLFWVRSYLRLLATFPRRGIPDLPLDPLAPWTVDER
jgi:hypothetical protein